MLTTHPPWTRTEKLSLAFLLLAFGAAVFTIHLLWRAFCDEKEHAGFLFSCTHSQRPEECENTWIRQDAVRP